MKFYKNLDGSFDIVNNNGILYHFDGRMKRVGRINDGWKHHRPRTNSIPLSVWEAAFQIQDEKIPQPTTT